MSLKGNSLEIQWLGLGALTAGALGSMVRELSSHKPRRAAKKKKVTEEVGTSQVPQGLGGHGEEFEFYSKSNRDPDQGSNPCPLNWQVDS